MSSPVHSQRQVESRLLRAPCPPCPAGIPVLTDSPTVDSMPIADTLRDWLEPLYDSAGTAFLLASIRENALRHGLPLPSAARPQALGPDYCVLITYGDIVQRPGEYPLATLGHFLRGRLDTLIPAIHILPFYPHSSDDGFSVMDYRAVDAPLGTWEQVRDLGMEYDLMFDLVLNHVSRKSQWFANYMADVDPGRDYFIEVDPRADLRAVVRPRSTPLLAAVATARGEKHIWATFSDDQMDLDFANPRVLAEFIDIIFGYVTQGARLLRLDAVAFIWKKLGTSCVHLPETHRLIKFLRALLAHYAPGLLLITETNVPHRENISYLTDGDEAHVAYQFALPPLVLHSLLSGSCEKLQQWAASLPPLPGGCHFLNFTASHDGIGLRAVEEILDEQEIRQLVDHSHAAGGFVSTRAGNDGRDHPYELNVSYFSALEGQDGRGVQRFICSQAISLALRGIPALYFHSLTGTPNDLARVESSGRYRTINRRRWDVSELDYLLDHTDAPQARVFARMRRLLELRQRQPAFAPDAGQRVLDLGSQLFAVERQAPGGGQTLLAVHNVSDRAASLPAGAFPEAGRWLDVLTGNVFKAAAGAVTFEPYQIAWFTAQQPA